MQGPGFPWPSRGLGLALALCTPAVAQVDAELERRLGEERRKLEDVSRALDDAQRTLDANRRTLAEQRARVDAILRELSGRGAAPVAPPAAETSAGAGQAVAQSGGPERPAKPVGEAPPASEQLPQAAQIFAEPTVLTRAGGLTLEPSLQYIYASNNRVALVGFTIIPAITIGLIDIRRVQRDAYYAALTARYGVTSRFELEAKLPWVYSQSSTVTRPIATPSVTDSQFDAHGDGIGDVEFGGRYQLNAFRGDNAVYIGGVRVRAPTGKGPFDVTYDPVTNLQSELATGAGFWGIQPGISFLFPSDPVVFFGGLTYTFNLERNVGNGFGKIKPGNVLDFSFGMGFALNEKASFSFGYQQSIVSATTQVGPAGPGKTLSPSSGSTLGTARFGLTYAFSRKTAVNLSLGIGVTDETPDLELTVRVPMSF
jgi:hypothetical protein